MSHLSTLQLSLSDVARLAGVRRPVVSMWRNRELAGHPFPKPVAVAAGQERFDAFEVVDYLAATGRGNNPEARDDLAAHAQLTAIPDVDETTSFDGLTALLCLAAVTGNPLGDLDGSSLSSLADKIDSDDTFLRREIESLGAAGPVLAAHAEALADASYSPASAFELLLRQQLARTLPGHAAVALRADAQAMVGSLASALASESGMVSPVFVDVTDGSGDLLLATARVYAGESAPSLASVALDTRSARLVRRRLRVQDLHRVDVLVDDAGDFAIPDHTGGAIHVLQLPPAGRPSMSDVEVLDAIADLVVQLRDDSRIVVIGHATALTDRPGSNAVDRARDAVLRSDRLRAAVRLPKGLLIRSPRRHLALWALGPAHPDVAVGDRWTVTADLSERELTPTTVEDLLTDIVAAMQNDAAVRRHAFRFSRRVRTASLLPGSRPLVDRPHSPVRRRTSGTELVALIDRLANELHSEASALRVEPTEAVEPATAPQRTLGDAVAAGECRIISGNRIDPEHLTAADGRVAIGPDELLGARSLEERRIDVLTFAGTYPSARFTEAGDVVFCTTPRIAAIVDHDGGSVVVSPARVARISRHPDHGWPPLLPDVLASDINAIGTPEESGATRRPDWRRWPIRRVPSQQRDHLAATLTALERERQELRTRLDEVEALAAAVTEGVTAGALTITAPPTSTPAYDTEPQPDTPAHPPRTNSPTTEGS
ncbi:hypothetical protein [Humibacillus xanthopallidus]|uniref:Uncharacterized protein n=1 Tax=Humibacillus xanthopallidus TaxID=412689 RepID=A0A543HZQ0_9MICO|nr:hypothetical protein [Humibacillus xanthopallidus]TQM63816.1 hypothetical protein FBY41_0169 [Humibacillus xanthopallidus]